MAIYRNVNMSFWTDSNVVDDYTPQDKYFMLYALTGPYTNIIGCYEVSIKQIAIDLGYDFNSNTVENLLKRFIDVHKALEYDFETKELFVLNWYKYNWNSSPKLDIPLRNAIENVKSDKFHDKLASIFNDRNSVKDNEDLLIPYRCKEKEIKKKAPKKKTKTKSKIVKKVYGEYKHVELADKELQTLISKYGDIFTNKLITYLDEYIEDTGYKRKSHYLCIKRWVVDAVKEKEEKDRKNNKRKEPVPNWLNKDIKKEEMSEKELRQFEEEFKSTLNLASAERIEEIKKKVGS